MVHFKIKNMETVEDDAIYDSGFDDDEKSIDKKKIAKQIFNDLISDDELMKELNALLRDKKIEHIKNIKK